LVPIVGKAASNTPMPCNQAPNEHTVWWCASVAGGRAHMVP
jgi:hypothetical protein